MLAQVPHGYPKQGTSIEQNKKLVFVVGSANNIKLTKLFMLNIIKAKIFMGFISCYMKYSEKRLTIS